MSHYTRKHTGYPTRREAHVYLEDISGSRHLCTMVTVGRKGMGKMFHTDVEMSMWIAIRVEGAVPGTSEKMVLAGT